MGAVTDTDRILTHSLVGTGNVDKAAIFNSEGNSVWATSAGFTVRQPYPLHRQQT